MDKARAVSITFAGSGERIVASLLDDFAPVTCEAVWKLADTGTSLQIRHVIFTGRELGMHVPPDVAGSIPEFQNVPPENQSVFPAPGDVMFQYCPPYQFAGDPEPVYDLSICYGPDTRLLMPWGWSPANRFAAVRPEHRDTLAAIGRRMVSTRSDQVTLARQVGTGAQLVTTASGDLELDARLVDPAVRHSTIFDTYHSLTPGGSFVLINDHDPKSLYYHFAAEYAGAFTWLYVDKGPDLWRIRIGKSVSET